MVDRAELDRRVRRLESLSNLLDAAIRIPGTDIRMGLDGLIGLIPGFGDLAVAIVSGYIVLEARQLGVPTRLQLMMVLNIVLDAVVGIVPVAGDVFDIYFKANQRNVRLLKQYVATI